MQFWIQQLPAFCFFALKAATACRSNIHSHVQIPRSPPLLSDPLRALELQPYSLKPLLRRAMAYESLERYRKAYVDYKTVLQLDTGIQAAHDSIHRSAEHKNPNTGNFSRFMCWCMFSQILRNTKSSQSFQFPFGSLRESC